MNHKLIFSMLLASVSVGSQANSCGTATTYERGTNNNWGNQNPMVCSFFGKWHATTNFSATGSLKFEVTGNQTWGENYGDNNLSNSQADASGSNIPVNQTGNIGVQFDYTTKNYVISKCNGNSPNLDAGTYPPTPRSMSCGPDGLWSKDMFFAPSNIANADTSSPWPNGLSSIQLLNSAFQSIATITPPVSGRYRLAVAVNEVTLALTHQLIAQDCGGLGLNLTYINSTGHEQNVAMNCNTQNFTYSVNYNPATTGSPNIRFIDGANIAYGDNQPDSTLDASGNLIAVSGPSRITVDLHTKTYQIQPQCGTTSLSLLAPNSTGHEQSTPMTCGSDNKWRLQLNGSSNVLFRLRDAQNTYWGDNQSDGILDNSGNLIPTPNNVQVVVDYFSKTYTIQ